MCLKRCIRCDTRNNGDEPGLIVGDLRHDVRNIAFAADPSMAVIDQAIAGGIDLLIATIRCSSVPCMRSPD